MRKMPKQKVQLSQATVSTEDIQKICNRNYQNIFPIKNQNQIQNNQIMMQRNQIKEIISQMEIFVQLLIQQILLTSDENIKLKAHDMLMEVKNKGYQKVQSMNLELQESKDQKIQLSQFGVSQLKYFHLAHLEDQVEHISKEAFMQNKSNLQCEAQIQFSIYQSPLLLFTDLVKEIICRNFKEREQIIRILVDQFQPLINPFYLPIYEQKAKILASRGKFTELEDVLLLLGLKKYHLKHQNNSIQPYFDLIQVYYLKDKTRQQIKNRFKNQICARAHDNIIKRWKNTQNLNLLQQERKLLLNGIQWFGTNENAWHLISKYFFMDDRSADFLRLEYEEKNFQRLSKRKIQLNPEQSQDLYQNIKQIVNKSRMKSLSLKEKESSMQTMQVEEEKNRQPMEVECLNYDSSSMSLNSDEHNQSFEEFLEEDNTLYKVVDSHTYEVEELNPNGQPVF